MHQRDPITEPQQSGDVFFELRKQYRTSIATIAGALLVIVGSVVTGSMAVAESRATLERVTRDQAALSVDLDRVQASAERDRLALERIELMICIICARQAPDAPECQGCVRGHR